MAAKDQQRSMDSSTFVEVGSEDSDYELDFVNGVGQEKQSAEARDVRQGELGGDLSGQISQGVATYVWQEGQQRARKAFSLYANIDILRPYFNVEPHEVRKRLFTSLFPRFQLSSDSQEPIPSELYGPTMLVLTLIAMLLYQMKSQSIIVQEGTLMGTAFGTCFGYWLGTSGLVLLAAYVCSTNISMLQLLNLLGYGLFGHCIVLFLTTAFHPSHNHVFFYSLWMFFGGLASLRIASVLMSRTARRTQKIIVCAIVVSLHLLFLLYLHFAYHHVVEDISAAFEKSPHLPTVQLQSSFQIPVSRADDLIGGNRSLLMQALKVKRSILKSSTLSQLTAVHHSRTTFTSNQFNGTLAVAAEEIFSHAVRA